MGGWGMVAEAGSGHNLVLPASVTACVAATAHVPQRCPHACNRPTWMTRQRKGLLVSSSCTSDRPSTVATTRRPEEKPSTVKTQDSVTPAGQAGRV